MVNPSTAYGPGTRRQLRDMLIANRVEFGRAAMIVDLACLAADRAMNAAFEAAEMAGDDAARMMALEIAAQLAGNQFRNLLGTIAEFGRDAGLPRFRAEVEIAE